MCEWLLSWHAVPAWRLRVLGLPACREKQSQDDCPASTSARQLCRWNAQILEVCLPEQLADLLETYLDRGHEVASPDSHYVFTRPDGTNMVKSDHLAQLWSTILRVHLKSDSKLTPHM